MSLTVVFGPHKNPRIDGLSDAQRLHWILEFTRRDLDAVASDELRAIGDDLRHAAAPWWVHEAPYPCPNGEDPDMSAAQLCALQQEIRECIHAVMDDPMDMRELTMIHRGYAPPRGWVLPEGPTRLVCLRAHRDDPHGLVMAVSDTHNDRTAIMMGVAYLLSTCGDRLCTCQVCGTRFLRQYRQEYCTVRCSNKVRNRRRLDRKAEQKKSQRHDATRAPDTASLTTA
jgi:hypothetical protein